MTEATDKQRRRFLTTVTASVGGVGAVLAAVPFVQSMAPSARARASGGPTQIDISKLAPAQMISDIWRGRPIWVLRRTPQILDRLAANARFLVDPNSDVVTQQPNYAKNLHRSINPEVLILVGLCTHLGCVPLRAFTLGEDSGLGKDWPGGFYCPCHGSKFDFAGRVFKNVPAPTNLVVPPYRFVKEQLIEIGTENV